MRSNRKLGKMSVSRSEMTISGERSSPVSHLKLLRRTGSRLRKALPLAFLHGEQSAVQSGTNSLVW
jgi:hypothetical protein